MDKLDKEEELPMRRSGGGDAMMGGFVMLVGLIMIVILVLAIWATIKAVDLVIRAWHVSRGKSQQLKIALLTWFGVLAILLLSVALTGARVIPESKAEIGIPVLAGIWGISTISLLITARLTELRYRQLFMSEPESLITKVFKRPWWSSGQKQKQVA
jgi:hypothetical protein